MLLSAKQVLLKGLNVGRARWLGLFYCGVFSVSFGQGPPNDDFTNATPLYGNSVLFSGTLTNATFEAGESTRMCGIFPLFGGSVWWSWTATNSTDVVIDVQSQDNLSGPPGFTVGDSRSVNAVNEFDCSYMDSLTNRYIRFTAIAGTNYYIRALGQSGSFALRLTATNAPVIFRQPQSQTVSENESVMFGVMAGGYLPLKYQWQFNGSDLPGQTAQSLVMHYLARNRAGAYSVVVSNVSGVATSTVANLSFTAYTNPPILLSARQSPDPSQFQFSLTGESGRVYFIEVTDDFTNWHREFSLGASFVRNTNTTSIYSFEIYETPKYVRASPSMNTEICIAQLEAIDLATKTWAIEAEKSVTATVSEMDITPYLRNPVVCPSGGTTF